MMELDWAGGLPPRVAVIAGAGFVCVLVLLLVWRRSRRARRRGGRRQSANGRVVMVPPGPEEIRIEVPTPILGLEPTQETSTGGIRRLIVALFLVGAAGLAGRVLLHEFAPSPRPATGASDRARVVTDRPERQELPDVLVTEDRPTSGAAVDSVRGIQLIPWSGDHQEGEPNRPLRRAIGVVLRDSLGQPIEGMEIKFVVPEGGGQADPVRERTNELGLATSTWRLGTDPDSLRVDVGPTGAEGLRVRFTATFSEAGLAALAAQSAREERAVASTPPVERRAPAPIAALRPRASLAAGAVHTCTLDDTGTLDCWGGVQRGGGRRFIPETGGPLRTVVAGVFHSCGLTAAGTIVCWTARPGAGPNLAAPAHPITLPDGAIPVDVIAGSEHSCALASNGAVYCWGSNTHGQLGSGTTDDSADPIRVLGLPPAAQLSTGWLHSCALSREGQAYCWGANASGQLGDGTTTDRFSATPVLTNVRFTLLTAGSAHTCARTGGSIVYCWGGNNHGQLGTGDTERTAIPAKVATSLRFESVAAGGVHTCGLLATGEAWCWGGNTFGQLGNGTTADSEVPTQVAGGHVFADIAPGGAHTCARGREGLVYCWGSNVQGQLGDGTLENRSEPTLRVGN